MTPLVSRRLLWLLLGAGLLIGVPAAAEQAASTSPSARAERPAGQAQAASSLPALEAETASPAFTGHFPQDPLLMSLLSWAEMNNADLELATARLNQAQAEREFAAAERRPWLHGGLNTERRRLPENRMRDSEGNRLRIPAYRSNHFDMHLSAGYEIDLFGRQKLRAASADALLAASEAERRAVRLSVRHEVIAAYADFRLASDLLALAQRAGNVQGKLLDAVTARVGAGVDAPSRARAAAHEADNLRQEIAGQEAARQHALARLAQLLGEEVSSLAPELIQADTAYFADDVPLPGLPARLPASLLSRRPDIAAAGKMLEASKMDAERIRRERYPALTLTGSLGFVSESLQRWLRGESLAWLAGSALGGPLLDGGRNAARHVGAQAASEAAEAAWRRQVYTALAEVESALSQLAASETQLALRTRQQARLQNALDNARQAQASGRHARTEVLATEVQTLEHEAQLRSMRRNRLAAWAASRHALGE